jgi:hypothetical protein
MADPGLAEDGYLFINHRMLQVQSEYASGVLTESFTAQPQALAFERGRRLRLGGKQ